MNLAEKNFKVWSNQPFDKETTKEVYRLKEKLDRSEFNDIFHKDLEFGTGGMRGIMGIGPNRINKYSLGKTTQGICNFINDLKIKEPRFPEDAPDIIKRFAHRTYVPDSEESRLRGAG